MKCFKWMFALMYVISVYLSLCNWNSICCMCRLLLLWIAVHPPLWSTLIWSLRILNIWRWGSLDLIRILLNGLFNSPVLISSVVVFIIFAHVRALIIFLFISNACRSVSMDPSSPSIWTTSELIQVNLFLFTKIKTCWVCLVMDCFSNMFPIVGRSKCS